MSWSTWTQPQKAALRAWIEEQDTPDTVVLRQRIATSPILTTETVDVQRARDVAVAIAERFAKNVAQEAGIAAEDTMEEMNAKLQGMIAAAATADKPLAVYRAAAFWPGYFLTRVVDGSGEETETVQVEKHTYGPTPAQAMNLGVVTGSDIEHALRDREGG